ncbi:hypothetical protein F4779DRAFT_571198 [Xylariaceae sp. FL0662B]|nr:hypothetical protein F4779DRAFT_571198 [Xylariaceae sp. FL0662B]
MNGSRSVCLLCRHKIAISGFAGVSQRQTQRQIQPASFSTTAAPRNDDPTTESSAKHPTIDRIRRYVPNERPPGPKATLSRDGSRPVSAANTSARVDALFQQIVQEQNAINDAPAADTSADVTKDLALVQAIGKLQRMVDKNPSVADTYAYLKTEIYPMIRQPGIHVPRVLFHNTVSSLMDKVISAKKEDIRSRKLPTVADILRVYVDIGQMKPQLWAALVGDLVQAIIKTSAKAEDYETIEAYEEQQTTRNDMLADLIDSWKILSMPKVMPAATTANEMDDGFWFPRLDKFSLNKFSKTGNFPAAFNGVFPQYPQTQLRTHVAVLAIATLALLLDTQRCNPPVRKSAVRFINKVAYLITFVRYRDKDLRREILRTFPGLEGYIMYQWPNIKAQLKHKVEAADTMKDNMTVHLQQPGSPSLHASEKIDASSLGKRLSQAYGKRNSAEVDRLWRSFIGSDQVIPEERAAELRQYPHLFDSFINTRMALNQPDQAILAWNALRRIGLKPTMKTWNVMLDGCKKAHNINGLRTIWEKLASSGMKLDTKIWTTRVSGLIESGDVKGGIKALEEMNKLWNERDTNPTAVKPTIEPVNAALVGLIRQNKVSEAERLLIWASNHNIEPDIFTINTLLRPLIRDARDKEVRALFNFMRDQGLQADPATFTIVLDAAFSKVAPDDVESQAKTVAGVLKEMQAAGLETNLQTYGKIIDHLLRAGDRAKEAVKAVLAHLWGQGLELSPHIYTMLVEHYLAREPPDLDAVESLLERRRLLDFDDVDCVFYERVVRGYALVGRADQALDIYHRLSRAGGALRIGTLTDLLRALLKQGRDDDARALVRDAKARYEDLHLKDPSAGDAYWNHPFWQLAARHRLVEPGSLGVGADAGNATSAAPAGDASPS